MFKVITDFVEKPILLLMCDRQCGITIQAPLTDLKFAHHVPTHAQFVQAAAMQGWQIGIESHVCPRHAQQEKANLPLVEVPRIVLAGGGRKN